MRWCATTGPSGAGWAEPPGEDQPGLVLKPGGLSRDAENSFGTAQCGARSRAPHCASGSVGSAGGDGGTPDTRDAAVDSTRACTGARSAGHRSRGPLRAGRGGWAAGHRDRSGDTARSGFGGSAVGHHRGGAIRSCGSGRTTRDRDRGRSPTRTGLADNTVGYTSRHPTGSGFGGRAARDTCRRATRACLGGRPTRSNRGRSTRAGGGRAFARSSVGVEAGRGSGRFGHRDGSEGERRGSGTCEQCGSHLRKFHHHVARATTARLSLNHLAIHRWVRAAPHPQRVHEFSRFT